MNKKFLAALCASAMLMSVCTACGGDSSAEESSAAESSAAETTTAPAEESSAAETAAQVTAEDIEFEDQVVAQDGDAILAIVDGQWYVQYWGEAKDILTYDAGIAHINGDGDYTVSVNVGTKGAQFDITGNPEDGYECGGLSFACIKVLNGTNLFPDMCIEVKEIRVDGKPIELTAKNYTSSDDGVEMRANIFNSYVNHFPDDAHTADGAVTGEFGEYSAQIVDTASFAKWTTVEVDFTVTGTGAAAAEGGDAAESSEESQAAEAENGAEDLDEASDEN